MHPNRSLPIGTPMHTTKRHFLQAHRKTSLFGSENEDQGTDMSQLEDLRSRVAPQTINNELHNVFAENGAKSAYNCASHSMNSDEQIDEYSSSHGKNASDNIAISKNHTNIESLEHDSVGQVDSYDVGRKCTIKEKGEFEELMNGTNKLVRAANHRARLKDEQKRLEECKDPTVMRDVAPLQTPWHTDFNADANNGYIKQTRYSRESLSKFNVANGDQNDVGKTHEQNSSTKRPNHSELLMGVSKEEKSFTRKQSVIGESFMNLFGVSSRNADCKIQLDKVGEKSCTNPTSLHSTPYAHHYGDD